MEPECAVCSYYYLTSGRMIDWFCLNDWLLQLIFFPLDYADSAIEQQENVSEHGATSESHQIYRLVFAYEFLLQYD